MTAETLGWVAIGLLGLVTLATRVGGVYLGRFLPSTPFWQRFLQQLPSTLLVAIALPAFLHGEAAQLVAAAVTLLVATRRVNLVIVMAIGMASVALMRAILPA
ncbi:MAG: AzlD domain-containing protein [Burkholderiaceae bacterium]